MEIPPGDLFEVQDEVVRKVVAGIAPNIRSIELRGLLRKRPESFTAYDHTLRRAACHQRLEPGEDARGSGVGWTRRWKRIRASRCRWRGLPGGTASGSARGGPLTSARTSACAMALTTRAIGLDEQNALALAVHGHLLSYLCHQPDAALTYFRAGSQYLSEQRARLDVFQQHFRLPGMRKGGAGTGRIRPAAVAAGSPGLPVLLTPRHRELRGRNSYEEAARWMRVAHSECPSYTTAMKVPGGGACRPWTGSDEAREIGEIIMSVEPGFRLGPYEQEAGPRSRIPDLRARFIKHLRMAGLPD